MFFRRVGAMAEGVAFAGGARVVTEEGGRDLISRGACGRGGLALRRCRSGSLWLGEADVAAVSQGACCRTSRSARPGTLHAVVPAGLVLRCGGRRRECLSGFGGVTEVMLSLGDECWSAVSDVSQW